MTNKKIKQLASLSYLNNNLNQKTVKKISSKLDRKELKKYIKILKMLEKKKIVYITLPTSSVDKQMRKNLIEIFKGKKIIFKVDKNLIAGIKIVDFDNVYDFSLSSKLNNIIADIN